MIYLDVTRESVVVVCGECGIWQAMRFTKLEAWTAAAEHEKRAHPGCTQAQNALTKERARRRHAV